MIITALACGCPNRVEEIESNHVLLFSAGGDLMVTERSITSGQPSSSGLSLQSVSSFFRSRDLVIANLEAGVDYKCEPQDRSDLSIIPEELIVSLGLGGLNAFNLANDHSLDCGRKSLDQFMQWLIRANLYPLGAGFTMEQARSPVYVTRNEITLGIESFTMVDPPGIEPCDGCVTISRFKRDTMIHGLNEMKQRSDHQIVIVHWGREDQRDRSPEVDAIALEALDFGAEIFIGLGPRFPMSVKRVRGRWILYSLGSLMVENEDGSPSRGLVFSAEFTADQIRNPRLIPVRFGGGKVEFLRGAEAEPIFRGIMERADTDTRTHLTLVDDILYLR